MGIIQINMSSSCLKLLLALTLFVIITECRPNRRSRKECKDDDDCSPGFSCIQTRKKGNVCAKARPEAAKPNPETDVEEGENHNADATNGDEDDGDALVNEDEVPENGADADYPEEDSVVEDEVPENDEADADYPEGNDVDETDNTEDDENDEDDGTDYPDGENPSDEPDDTEVTEDDAADYPEGEGPSDEPDDTEEPEGDENDEHDDADYPEDEGIDVPFDESDEGDENNEDDADDFTEFAGNNEGGPRPQNDGPRPQNDGLDAADENEVTDVYPTFPTENPIGEEESSDAGDEMAATDFPPQMKESDSAQQGRSYKRVRAYGGKEGAMKTYGCHEKINSILKKVLKKLKMSQAVENNAYEMVEEMMMERDIDMELEY